MADDKGLDITSVFGDVIKQVQESIAPTKKTTKKTVSASKSTVKNVGAKNTKKTSTAKKSTTKSSTAKKTTTAKKSTTAKSSTAKKTTTAKKSTTTKKNTTTKKAGKIYLEISGRQIDFKTIESKAAKLGGDCYVVVNEKKIYNKDGKSVNLFS